MNKCRERLRKSVAGLLASTMVVVAAVGGTAAAQSGIDLGGDKRTARFADPAAAASDWFRSVYAESDSATAEGRGDWLLQLYATRTYRRIEQDGKTQGLEQSLADWVSLHERLPYGTDLHAATTIDTVSYPQADATALVRGRKHFEMTYYDLLSGGVETDRSDEAFEDLWVQQGTRWRLQWETEFPPSMRVARAP
ncbi:hypothetical protein [Nevskia soli]|uniref:hypothetical protein n=1 Tax=Nevskia soli TaxID=418856 RepID=UPI0012FB1D79|nr:hypothetical protein [Nevskia soli]